MPSGRRPTPPPATKPRTINEALGNLVPDRTRSVTLGAFTAHGTARASHAQGFYVVPVVEMPIEPFMCGHVQMEGAGDAATRDVDVGIFRAKIERSGELLARRVVRAVDGDTSWTTTDGARLMALEREISVDPRTGLYFVGIYVPAATFIWRAIAMPRGLGLQSTTATALPSVFGYGTTAGEVRVTRNTTGSVIAARLLSKDGHRVLGV